MYVSHTFGNTCSQAREFPLHLHVCHVHLSHLHARKRLSSNRVFINIEHAMELVRQRKGENERQMETISVEKQQGSEESSTIERNTNKKVYRQLPFHLI